MSTNVRFRLLLCALLTPLLISSGGLTCERTGDTRLLSLEFEVDDVNRLAFDTDLRVYALWLPAGATTATIRAEAYDSDARVNWYTPDCQGHIDGGPLGVGGGEVTVDLPPDDCPLYVSVIAPGGAANTYIITTNPVCPQGDVCYNGGVPGTCINDVCEFLPFPCTEQGILDAVAFGSGPHYFTCNGPTTVTTQAKIVIDNDVILDGRGDLTIDAGPDGPPHGVLDVGSGVTVELLGMTLTGGECYIRGITGGPPGGSVALTNAGVLRIVSSSVSGNNKPINQQTGYLPCGIGGISNSGTLTLIDSDVSQNRGYQGVGGISNAGTLELVRSQVRQNSCYNGSSAIGNGGMMTLVDSDVSNNSISGSRYGVGSGSAIRNSGSMLLRRSTVSRNYGGLNGPTISSGGPATLINTTVAGNSWYAYSPSVQVTISQSAGVLEVVSSTISGPQMLLRTSDSGEIRTMNSVISSIPDTDACAGSIIDGGGNIESPSDSCSFALSGVPTESLHLGPLADNGGLTETQALLPGSVAIDMIDSSACVDADGAPLTEDQRGVARPQGSQCDAGAFEWADCSGTPCDDGNDCTADHCDPLDTSWCEHTELADGTFCGADGVCEAGACRERSWGTAVLIETNDAGNATSPQVAVDPSGNATAVWSQHDVASTNIWSNRYTPGGGWGTAVLIETEDAVGAVDPHVAVDPNGNVTAVWAQRDDTGYYDIWANRYTASVGWGAAVLIETDDAGDARSPHVAVDPNGNATAVWSQSDGTLKDIWANRYTPGGGWGTPVLIETVDGEANFPLVAVDPNGNVTAVWTQYDGSGSNIWSNRYTPGGGWGTAELIETDDAGDARSPQVAVDPNGNATAVWRQSDGPRTHPFVLIESIWSNRYTPGGGWGTPVLIETVDADEMTSGAHIAVDPNGNATAVWMRADGTAVSNGSYHEIWSNRYTPGGGWGAAELIATGGASRPVATRVGVDPNGNATAVWGEYYDGSYQNIWSNRYTPGGGWGAAVLIESANSVLPPQVGVDPNGNATAVWSQRGDGSRYYIWANRYE